jgi:hypothetical protein
MDDIPPRRHLELARDHDQGEALDPAPRPADQDELRPPARLLTYPQGRHRRPSPDRDQEVGPRRLEWSRAAGIQVMQPRHEARLAQYPLGLGKDLPDLVGPAQRVGQRLRLRVVAQLVADQKPD